MATVSVPIDIRAATLGTSAIPELVYVSGTNAPVMGYAFDGATREDVYLSLPLLNYGSGNITVKAKCYSKAGVTSGTFVFGARIACSTDGDSTSMEAKNWATAQQSSNTTINSTAKGPKLCTVTVSNLDGATAGDEMWLNLYRLPADSGDTITSDIVVTNLWLEYSDT
jgi:hypothetical protein